MTARKVGPVITHTIQPLPPIREPQKAAPIRTPPPAPQPIVPEPPKERLFTEREVQEILARAQAQAPKPQPVPEPEPEPAPIPQPVEQKPHEPPLPPTRTPTSELLTKGRRASFELNPLHIFKQKQEVKPELVGMKPEEFMPKVQEPIVSQPAIEEFRPYPKERQIPQQITVTPVMQDIAEEAAPIKDNNTRNVIVFNLFSVTVFAAGFYIALTSKAADNFDAFYWYIVLSNVLMSLSIVLLYHSVDAMIDVVRAFIQRRKLENAGYI